jgi:hypothetical protein
LASIGQLQWSERYNIQHLVWPEPSPVDTADIDLTVAIDAVNMLAAGVVSPVLPHANSGPTFGALAFFNHRGLACFAYHKKSGAAIWLALSC